ncbi:calcium-binding protein [Celeribacter ethanolicus]|uniref:Calcium-binding protein n=1 Tax=Celeribacter ethanolicus TaxID=1758178 RepID=A0A291GG79_9RHOB|nr:EF-hand domain-containing protein [Celeribacter ethanolicus]ATG49026.1 calcium-binding protein [Celeribacter ethanolicus]
MKNFALSLSLMAALPFAAQAQGIGGEFMTNWDLNEDGQVTLAEVRERRGDLFYMFDEDEDGKLNDAEYATFDETRAMDREMHLEEYGTTMGPGQGQGLGQGGQAQGQGPRGPRAFAAGIDSVQASMTRKANDLNRDGVVTRAEFVGNGDQWFARMDRNRDGVVTLGDFGN